MTIYVVTETYKTCGTTDTNILFAYQSEAEALAAITRLDKTVPSSSFDYEEIDLF
jgi:hypothetical protein